MGSGMHKTTYLDNNSVRPLAKDEDNTGVYQDPTQIGFFESDEPGIKEPEDAVDADSIRKGGGAAWARAHGLEVQDLGRNQTKTRDLGGQVYIKGTPL